MLLFVGLGNPGKDYAGNRHNIGFMAVDRIADDHGFGPESRKFQGLMREGRLGTGKVITLKPGTFMNESGRAVGEALRFYKLDPADVIVFHDELDLAPGKLRCKTGGGHAGHNGLRSIHAHIGAEYRRVRLGIGHPGHKSKVSGYVLHDFAKAERDWLDPLLEGIGRAAPMLAAGDEGRFMSDVAQDMQDASPRALPPKPAPARKRAAEPDGGGGMFDALKGLFRD